ncbi:MAG: hypothetical protein E3J72_19940, partial [Planctomycetota bacterium]
KYNPDGTLAWAKRAGGGNNERGWDISTLSDGSAIVTGDFVGSAATFGAGEVNETDLTSAGSNDIFIAKYNPDGTLAWAKSAGGGSDDQSYGISALSDGSAIVTGYFSSAATFGSGEANETDLSSAGVRDIFIAKYNPDGMLNWAKKAGSTSDDYSCDISALSDDSVLVTGCFEATATFGAGDANETTLDSYGGFDIFIAKYNP